MDDPQSGLTASTKCLLCAAPVLLIHDAKERRHYAQCTQCQVIFQAALEHLDSNQERTRYLQHNNDPGSPGYIQYFQKFIDQAITPFCAKGSHILDFGCGTTPLLASLLQPQFSVDYYDPFFFPDSPFRENQYDCIVATEVFEHLSNPLKELTLLLQHLKEGGLLALMTLFHPGSTPLFLEWWYRRDPTHIVFYNEVTFEYLAKRFDLEKVFCNQRNIVVLRKPARIERQ